MNFVLLFISMAIIAQSQEPLADAEGFISRLQEKSKNTESISAEFTEEKFLSFLKEPQKSSGVFYYQARDKMRWEQINPSEYIILINDDQMRLQENGVEKNIKGAKRITSKVKDLMLTMIKGDFHENKAFDSKYFQNGENFIAVLVPRNKKLSNVYEKIELHFSKKDLNLNQLTFFEKGGDKSVMNFFNQKLNQKIAAHRFSLL